MRVRKIGISSFLAVAYAVVTALVVRATVANWESPWWAWAGSAASFVLVSLAWIALDRAWSTLRWRGYARPMLDMAITPAFGMKVRTLANTVATLWEGPDETNRLHPVERFREDSWRVQFDDGSYEDVDKVTFYYWLLACWRRQARGKNGLAQRYWEPQIGRRQLDARRALLLRASTLANYGPRKTARLKATPWPTFEAVEAVMSGAVPAAPPAPRQARDAEPAEGDLNGRYEAI